MTHRPSAAAGLAGLILLLALNGTDAFAPSHPEPAPQIVQVSLTEWSIQLSVEEIPAGLVRFEVSNNGAMGHIFKIGVVATDLIPRGQSRILEIALPAGTQNIWCPVAGHRNLGMRTTLKVTGEPTPPPNTEPPSISLYDVNDNCLLEDGEFFNALDQWIGQVINDALFFAAVDAWIGQINICALRAATPDFSVKKPINLLAQSGGLIFSAADQNIRSMAVEIFSLTGEKLYSSSLIAGRKVVWNFQSQTRERVANGLYLYRVILVNQASQKNFGPLEKLLVLR